MNIFVLDTDMEKSCQYHVDRHVVKMPLEHTQLLSTALRLNMGDEWVDMCSSKVYKKTHINHPCSVWVRESLSNWLWLKEYTIKLCEEYTYRYGKFHACHYVCDNLPTPELDDIGLTPFAQAMPEQYRNEDAITAYRSYYINEKNHLASWKHRERPEWYV